MREKIARSCIQEIGGKILKCYLGPADLAKTAVILRIWKGFSLYAKNLKLKIAVYEYILSTTPSTIEISWSQSDIIVQISVKIKLVLTLIKMLNLKRFKHLMDLPPCPFFV